MNQASTDLIGRHLRLVGLHDEPEAVARDGPDAEGGHDDGKILTGLHQTAEDFRVGPGIKTTKLFFSITDSFLAGSNYNMPYLIL